MIRLEQIGWEVAGFRLHDVSLEVPTGKYAVLRGRTGAGKTTLLEIICGLRSPLRGRVFIGDREVTRAQPALRSVGYVPQDGALFPTMTVRKQIAFAPEVRGLSHEATRRLVGALAEELELAPLLDRLPQDLSGGERQRVALGRALAAEPRVLVLDEPLAALDEELRDDLARLLRRAQLRHGLTVLHVTHSSAEAALVADLQFALIDGRVRQAG